MDSRLEALLQRHLPELSGYPASLAREIQRALEEAGAVLTDERELEEWVDGGVALARQSLRSWEASAEYFRVSPQVLRLVPYRSFVEWAGVGRELADESAALAGAYFRAAPASLSRLSLPHVREWAALGRQLYKGTWKSSSLAAQFFEVTPALLDHISLPEARTLVRFVDTLAGKSYELAAACLGVAPKVLGALDRADRGPFLGFAAVIAETSWADARVYFEKGPGLLHHVQPDERTRFMVLAGAVARKVGRQAYPFFAESATALGLMDQEAHAHLLGLAEQLAPRSGPAAMEFLKSVPNVLDRIRYDDIEAWHAQGKAILDQTEEGGLAFFRLESGKGEEVLDNLSSRVELSRVSEVLRMYCKALTGANVSIQATTTLAEKGVGWVSENRPTTEGSAVFLPAVVEETHDKAENFAIYKVYSTHQAAHLEFESFSFRFDRPAGLIDDSRQAREARRALSPDVGEPAPTLSPSPNPGGGQDGGAGEDGWDVLSSTPTTNPVTVKAPLTDMERFFDLFDDRQLASDLFTVVEDARIDYLIRREYGGIRRSLARVQRRELERRDPVERMPLRQALVENLIRVSLDGLDTVRWPAQIAPAMGAAIALLRQVQQDAARVEDTAEITLRLYDLAMSIPNVLPDDIPPEAWETLDEEMISLDMLPSGGEGESNQPGLEQLGEAMPEGTEQPYESPDAVDFRGDFKPELVQLLMRLRNDAKQQGGEGQFAPLTPEQLKELLEKSVEIDISAFVEGDLSESTGMFLSNLMKETGTPAQEGKPEHPMKDGQGVSAEEEEEEQPLTPQIEYFFYDEWDFRANDYKPRWCRVVQRTLDEGEDNFFDKTLAGHSALVSQTRKQFELLRPEMFRKIKRLYDGEDLDLDLLIEYAVDRKAHITPSEKIYWRRNKIERDVAVAFLLDMSASTDEEINRRDRRGDDDDFDDDPRKYLTWWAQKRARELQNPPKRIIDVEKESTVLLMEALETIGDTYGIYGFSGYGRDNVEYYVIKDLLEPFGDRVKKRIDKIVPIRSTRMGPAIRHTISKLDQHDAKVKILILVSDGRPQDHGYGRDRTEKEYAIHDTKMALNEAKRKGIVPFALTVDRAGHDYLKTMCEDIGYEVVADIEALPSRLPTLYRKLTE
jgi:nitric oxide reductase NorD protein